MFQAEEPLEDKDVIHSSKYNKTCLSFQRESWRNLVFISLREVAFYKERGMRSECSQNIITWRNIWIENGTVT